MTDDARARLIDQLTAKAETLNWREPPESRWRALWRRATFRSPLIPRDRVELIGDVVALVVVDTELTLDGTTFA